MVCESCGEKPKNTAKDFTKAVIEINNPEALVLLRKVVIPTSMGDEESVPPAIGKYRNVLLQYEANEHIYLYSSDGIPTAITANIPQEILDSIAELEATDVVLQQEIDDLKNSPDVVDIVPTYADLQAYDTSKLGDNDIIRVLQDEQHDGQSTYYRWDKQSSTWTYIGAVGDYYTKGQVDTLLTGKQNTLTAGSNITIENNVISATGTTYTAGSNVQISPENVISATDTTYTHFTGATASADGTAGLVPAPVAGDDTKFLSGDGTWGTPAGATYTAGANVQISAQNVISATDTTYSNFVGTDGQTAGTAGLVPAPATTDAGKFLKADGTWDTAGGGGPTVVQTTGTSTTSVMSQNATTKLVYPDIANYPYKMVIGEGSIADTNKALAINGVIYSGINGGSIAIGATDGNPATIGLNGRSDQSVAIGGGAGAGKGYCSVAIGAQSYTNSGQNDGSNVAIGYNSYAGNATARSSVALGAYSKSTRTGEVNVGTDNYNQGYNSTNYRVIGGVHDGQLDHDVATLGQLNGRVKQNAGAPTTATVGTVGQLLEDTTNGKLYICTDATNPYVWEEVGAGGGGTTEIEYVNCTLTGATATGFTLTADKTATQVKALVEAGKEVIYKFVNPTTAGSILAGTYEFSVLFAGTNSSVDVVTGYGMTEVSGTSTQGVYTFNHISSTVTVTAGSIPTVNDATLTIQKNGTTVQTFTANASSNATANIEVPTITMTTTDPGEGSALAADNFVAVYGGDPIIMDYSTSEINTGATWIDGSAIYKKTVNFGALPNATNKKVSHGIANLGTVVRWEGMTTNSGDSVQRPLPFVPTAGSGFVIVEFEPSDIAVYTDTDRTAFSAVITMYYTKSS